jgi:DNA polymerase ligase (LigD)-like protein
MLRFVILEHDHPHLHWDFMLEWGHVLRTWRLVSPPDECHARVSAEAIADHRLQYLDYEGPVSGDRGQVHRWDHGTYEVLEGAEDSLWLRMSGKRIAGQVRLEKCGERWTLTHAWSTESEIGRDDAANDTGDDRSPHEKAPG